MSSVRKHYGTDLKVKVVLEILKEEKTVTQLASEYKIHYSQLLKWKKQVLEGLPHLFSDSLSPVTSKPATGGRMKTSQCF